MPGNVDMFLSLEFSFGSNLLLHKTGKYSDAS